MPLQFSCPNGHRWERPFRGLSAGIGRGDHCPICGAAAITAAAAAEPQPTLLPSAADEQAGDGGEATVSPIRLAASLDAAAAAATLLPLAPSKAPEPEMPAPVDSAAQTLAPPPSPPRAGAGTPAASAPTLLPPPATLMDAPKLSPAPAAGAARPPTDTARPRLQPGASEPTLPPPPGTVKETPAAARPAAGAGQPPTNAGMPDLTLAPPPDSFPEALKPAPRTGPGRRADPPDTGRKPTGIEKDTGARTGAATRPVLVGYKGGPFLPGYELLAELGRGGMGVVYKARDLKLNRLVALKMILSGDYAAEADLARFRLEAEAVATLQHPNIVQVYEINEYAGRPYFCLEFVEGGSLDRKLDGTAQPYREAAALVEQLARAMDYAHKRHILHRDLKPANVLLTADGTPKIADFGLAKKLDAPEGHTHTGSIMGTPNYMAPEQAEGRIHELGPAADTYALGAILYEALVGRPPFKGDSVLDTLDQVCSKEPVPPSRLQPKAPRDLETICLKCLEKEPQRRYASAGDLADDLHRFLAGEPIQARPTPAWERAWKWARRRPLAAALTAVSALFVLSMIGGGVAFGMYEQQQAQEEARLRKDAQDEHRRAEENFRRAELNFQRAEINFGRARSAVDQMLTRVGQERLVYVPRMEQIRKDLLNRALHFYQQFLEERSTDPAMRWETGRAYLRMGDIREMLGEREAAENAYEQARAFLMVLHNAAPKDVRYRQDLAVLANNQGQMFKDAGRTPEAEKAFRDGLKLRQEVVAETASVADQEELANIANNLGLLLLACNRFKEAETVLGQALELREKLAAKSAEPRDRLALGRSNNNLGILLGKIGRLDEAEADFTRALDIFQKLADQDPHQPDYRQELAISHNHLGNLWHDTTPKKAEQAYLQSLRLREQLVADYPTVPIYRQEQAASYHSLGLVRQAAGRHEEAETAYSKALAIREQLVADYPKVPDYRFDLGASYNNRGVLFQTVNLLPEAEKSYRKALPLLDKLVAEQPDVPAYRQELAATLQNLSVVLQLTRQADDAEKTRRRALDLREQLAEKHPRAPVYQKDVADSQLNLGVLWQMSGDLPKAESYYRRAIDMLAKLAGEHPTEPDYRHLLAIGSKSLGNLLRATNHPKEAEQSWRKAMDLLTQLNDEQPGVPIYRRDLASISNELGIFLASTRDRTLEGAQPMEQAVALQEKLAADFPRFPAYRHELAKYQGNLALLHALSNRPKQAEQSYRRAIALLEELEKSAPDVPVYWQELITPYANLGDLLKATGGPASDVEKCWRRQVELKEKLTVAYPQVPDLQSDLGITLRKQAEFLRTHDQLPAARESLREAVSRQKAALALNSRSAGYRQQLCSDYLALAQAQLDLADHAGAAQAVAALTEVVPAGWPEHHVAAGRLARGAALAAKDETLTAAKRQKLVRSYSDRAMAELRQAVAWGYRDGSYLKTAPEFESLRGRKDFEELVAGLQGKAKQGSK